MLPRGLTHVLITTDAVGGVWRHALDLAAILGERGAACLLAGFGPPPLDARVAALPPRVEAVWLDAPLDWLTDDPSSLDDVSAKLAALARGWGADLLHVNAPSQACGLPDGMAVVAASHSCVPTWWARVRGGELPAAWRWQVERNRAGLDRAGAVLAPSRAHAADLCAVYGPIDGLRVAPNATGPRPDPGDGVERDAFVLAVGRWWDEGKGGTTLDRAAAGARWPVLAAGALQGPAGQRAAFAHAEAAGELPSADVRALMRRAAILAAPSRYEPFGLAVLEAAARGCALILSDIPTFRELWDGAAVFADPDDPLAWTAAIDALAEAPARRAALADAARRRAAGFTQARQLDAVLGAYAAALRRARPAAAA